MERAEASRTNGQPREGAAIETPLWHVHAKRFPPPEAAHGALTALATSWRDHQLATSQLIDHTRDAGQGRPPPRVPSRRVRGSCTPRSDPLRKAWRPTHHRAPAWSVARICTRARSAMRKSSEPIQPHPASRAGFDVSKTPGFLSPRCVSNNRVGFKDY